MRMFTLALLSLTTLSSAYGLSTSVSRQCINNSCSLKACVDNDCREFKGAAEGKFNSDASQLTLRYADRPAGKPARYIYHWSSRSFTAIADVVAQPAARVTVQSPSVRAEVTVPNVRVDARLGPVSVTATTGQQPAPVRVERQRPVLTPALIIKIQQACDDAFSFNDEDSCNRLLMSSSSPEWALGVLKIVDDEVMGFDKMPTLQMILNAPISLSKVKSCLDKMSFDSGKRSCLSIVRNIPEASVNACMRAGSFDDDKLKCLQAVSMATDLR